MFSSSTAFVQSRRTIFAHCYLSYVKFVVRHSLSYDKLHHKNRLTISSGSVELRKTGAGNFNSVLVFDTQHNKNCIYQSPAGPMELVSDTKKIRVLHGDAHFKLQLKYSLIMNGMLVSDYDLTVLAKFME